jgi:hypothetical protein
MKMKKYSQHYPGGAATITRSQASRITGGAGTVSYTCPGNPDYCVAVYGTCDRYCWTNFRQRCRTQNFPC